MPNARLKRAITDLNTVYDTGAEDLLYSEVETALTALQDLTDPYYRGQALTREAVEEIIDGYTRLMAACDAYIKENEKKNRSGMEVGRVECLKGLKGILMEDLRALNDSILIGEPGTDLLTCIQEGRSIEAAIEDQSTIKSEGGQMSSRIPIRLRGETGRTEEGFFTEKNDLKSFDEKLWSMAGEYKAKYGESSDIYKAADKIFRMSYTDAMNFQREIGDSLPNTESERKIMSEIPKVVYSLVSSIVDKKFDKDLKDKFMAETPEGAKLREETLSMLKSAMDYRAFYKMNHISTGIPNGENIDKRNVAMSTVANYFGLGNIIAEARSFTVKMGGREIKGTFQQKAVGEDIKRITKDSKFVGFAKYKEDDLTAVNSPELKMQLSDLQVIDYICGNCDRHSGNMLYRIETKDGKPVVAGITGIDNDMSFGTKNGAENKEFEKIVNPEEMRIMRLSTARKVIDLTPEKLDMILKDMNFTKIEMDNCKKRLSKLQKKIREDYMTQERDNIDKLRVGQILIVEDNKFKDYDVRDLAKIPADRENVNYFTRIASMAYKVKKIVENGEFAEPEKKVTYSDAKAVKGKLNFRDEVVRTNVNLDTTEERIRQAKEAFDALGSKWYGKDTGNYQWLKQSVNKLETYFRSVREANPGSISAEIPEADAVKVDAMFRQIRMAGENYINTHKAKPWTPSGKNRLNAAKEMLKFEAAYHDDIPGRRTISGKINNTDLKNLLGEEFSEVNKKKPGKKQDLNRSVSYSDNKTFRLEAPGKGKKKYKGL